jgi:hypothetical protein
MERVFLELLPLELLLRLREAEERLAPALESTLGTVRRSYPELLCVDPNGSTWIGFEWDADLEASMERFRRGEEGAGGDF